MSPHNRTQSYRDLGLWTEETFVDFISRAAGHYADLPALAGYNLAGDWEELTYQQLHQSVEDMAAILASHGVQQGHSVVVSLPNVTEFIYTIFALFRLGALPVFALPAHRQTELASFCTLSNATHIITGEKFGPLNLGEVARATLELVEQPPKLLTFGGELDCGIPHSGPKHPTTPTAKAEDVAFYQLSGGTTGTPKLIPRTHADYQYSVRESAKVCQLTTKSVMLAVLPVPHNFTMSSPGILGILSTGGQVVLARDPSPSTGFALIEKYKATITALVPPLAITWLNAAAKIPRDISSLKILQVGGAKLAPEVAVKLVKAFPCTLQQVFGMAEGLVNYTRLDDSDEIITTTQGRPLSPYDEIRILDNDGNPADSGLLYTRGPYTITGYLGGVDKESFTDDGFYCTGDTVRLHGDYLIVTGREKDQINRAGEKISAEEIENFLLACPGVIDAAVVGIPDPVLGEQTCAFLLGEVPEPKEIRAHLRARGVAEYKIPDTFRVLETFPTTAVGKVSRKHLRHILRSQITNNLT